MEPAFTRHAQARMQQRAIRADALEELFEHGREVFDHHGHATILYFDKATRLRLGRRRATLYAVVSADGQVITVGHRYRRIGKS